MYLTLLTIHNAMRWIVLVLLLYGIYCAFLGYRTKSIFSAGDNALRHWTATALQLQMVIGFVLYFNSPFVSAFWADANMRSLSPEGFFAIVHLSLMLVAVTVLSVGSALAKRRPTDDHKYKTMLTWFVTSLLIILIAIPWPFSPLAQRPYIRIL